MAWPTAAADGSRAGHPCRRAGSAGLHLGVALAAVRGLPTGSDVPVRAKAAGLEQAAAGSVAAGQEGDTATGRRYGLLVRQPLDHRLHAGGVRTLASNSEAVGRGRLGRIRVLR